MFCQHHLLTGKKKPPVSGRSIASVKVILEKYWVMFFFFFFFTVIHIRWLMHTLLIIIFFCYWNTWNGGGREGSVGENKCHRLRCADGESSRLKDIKTCSLAETVVKFCIIISFPAHLQTDILGLLRNVLTTLDLIVTNCRYSRCLVMSVVTFWILPLATASLNFYSSLGW